MENNLWLMRDSNPGPFGLQPSALPFHHWGNFDFFLFFNFIHWLIMVFGSDYYNISWNITNDVLLYEDFILEYFPWFWEKKYFEMKKVEKSWKKLGQDFFEIFSTPTFFNFFQFFSSQNIFFLKTKENILNSNFHIENDHLWYFIIFAMVLK